MRHLLLNVSAPHISGCKEQGTTQKNTALYCPLAVTVTLFIARWR